MKNRADRMQRVHNIAENEEREHCRAMGDAQRTLDEHQQRLHELRQYRTEYASRQPAGGSISSARWADYQNFLSRLDEAVDAQSQLVRQVQQNRDAHKQRWMAKRQKMESLQRVVERYRSDETRARERQQQKIMDDLPRSAGAFRRR